MADPDPLLEQAQRVAAERYRDVARAGVDHDQALNAALDAFRGVLATGGRYIEPSPEPRELTDEDLEKCARWLAEQSRHPRYVGVEDGWRHLLGSEVNVDHAFSVARLNASTPDEVNNLAAARNALLRHARQPART
jgi:hypothetical protein